MDQKYQGQERLVSSVEKDGRWEVVIESPGYGKEKFNLSEKSFDILLRQMMDKRHANK